MSENLKLKRFGRYLLLDHLVDGGMAKICRARFLSDDADKIVAIKMIQQQFSKDENFKNMFLDEIKVAFGLNHPNIAQTYDYGLYNDQLYTAMEYVDGANLKQFLDRLKEKKYVFPVEISTFIISQVCQGLSYAHDFTDKLTGNRLNIIHRDISPHNIMLTFDGAVKIIDFGIAKAETNSDSTQAGTIKGKLSYLAPEYLDGAKLDIRYDQFAVGITLWELLCSRKLFHSKNELAVLKQIQACKVPPPSTINPNVPKELDQIVLKALSKDRELRYENMDQFNRALVKFLYAQYPDFNSTDLQYFAKELFKTDIKKDRAKLVEFGKINITPYLSEWKSESTGGNKEKSAIGDGTEVKARRQVLNFELDESLKNETDAEGTKSKIILEGTKTDIQSSKTAIKGNKFFSPNSTRMIKDKINKKVSPKNTGYLYKVAAIAAALAIIVVKKDMILDQAQKIGLNVSASRGPANIEKAYTKKGILILSGLRQYHTLYLNGEKTDYSGLGIKVDHNQKIQLKVTEAGKKPFIRSFILTDGENSKSLSIPELKRVSMGEIYANHNYPAGTEIQIDVEGKKIIRPLPLESYRLPAGEYKATVVNKTLGVSKQIDFKVEEDRKIEIPK